MHHQFGTKILSKFSPVVQIFPADEDILYANSWTFIDFQQFLKFYTVVLKCYENVIVNMFTVAIQ